MAAYYNENNAEAARVLQQQIRNGVISPGEVDTRSIREVKPDDLVGYDQVHLFAGGGLWSVAARIAGWPDDKTLWSASCPCQGESLAGKRLGANDPRHLWPDVHRLLRACRPPVIVGEQVAAAAGTHWLDRVCSDLEDESYAARAVDIPACAVDAPHQRNRLYWIAVDDGERAGLEGQCGHGSRSVGRAREAGSIAETDGLLFVDAEGERRREGRPEHEFRGGRDSAADADPLLRNGSWWADAEWIVSPIDGKARRTKPGLPFLVDGLPGRVDLWRVAGNAISPVLAAEVLAAYLDTQS